MIVPMTRVRIAGPRELLEPTLALVQDIGALHVAALHAPSLALAPSDGEASLLRRVLDDVESALRWLGSPLTASAAPEARESIARARLFAARTRRRAERLRGRLGELEDERALLLRYEQFFAAFEPLVGRELRVAGRPRVLRRRPAGCCVVGRAASPEPRGRGRRRTRAALASSAERRDRGADPRFRRRRQEGSEPARPRRGCRSFRRRGARQTRACCARCPSSVRASQAIPRANRGTSRRSGERCANRDGRRSSRSCARGSTTACSSSRRARRRTPALHLFVIEGWIPRPELASLDGASCARSSARDVLVEAVATEPWSRGDAPVALAQPAPLPPVRDDHAHAAAAALRHDRPDAVRRRLLPDVLRADARRRRVRRAARDRSRSSCGCGRSRGTTLRSVSAVARRLRGLLDRLRLRLRRALRRPRHDACSALRPLGFDRRERDPAVPRAQRWRSASSTSCSGSCSPSSTRGGRGTGAQALGRGVAALMVALTVHGLLAALAAASRRALHAAGDRGARGVPDPGARSRASSRSSSWSRTSVRSSRTPASWRSAPRR